MVYTTKQNMIDRFGLDELIELTDRADPPAGVIDDVVLASAIADADSVINAYVGKRYGLPLSSAPAVLVKVSGDLARYNLHDEAPTDRVKDARDQAISFLKDISAGKADLDIAGTEAPAAENVVQVDGPLRVFSHNTLWDY